jgi:hypothetical protein
VTAVSPAIALELLTEETRENTINGKEKNRARTGKTNTDENDSSLEDNILLNSSCDLILCIYNTPNVYYLL